MLGVWSAIHNWRDYSLLLTFIALKATLHHFNSVWFHEYTCAKINGRMSQTLDTKCVYKRFSHFILYILESFDSYLEIQRHKVGKSLGCSISDVHLVWWVGVSLNILIMFALSWRVRMRKIILITHLYPIKFVYTFHSNSFFARQSPNIQLASRNRSLSGLHSDCLNVWGGSLLRLYFRKQSVFPSPVETLTCSCERASIEN